MLALVFEVDGETYGVPAARVVTVVRRPETRAVPGAPAWIGGLFAWDGAWVPLVDLSRLIASVPCPAGAASRVALVARGEGARSRMIGLLAPGMTRVTDVGRGGASPGLRVAGQDFLGLIDPAEPLGVQMLDIDRVLPPELDHMLFSAEAP